MMEKEKSVESEWEEVKEASTPSSPAGAHAKN